MFCAGGSVTLAVLCWQREAVERDAWRGMQQVLDEEADRPARSSYTDARRMSAHRGRASSRTSCASLLEQALAAGPSAWEDSEEGGSSLQGSMERRVRHTSSVTS